MTDSATSQARLPVGGFRALWALGSAGIAISLYLSWQLPDQTIPLGLILPAASLLLVAWFVMGRLTIVRSVTLLLCAALGVALGVWLFGLADTLLGDAYTRVFYLVGVLVLAVGVAAVSLQLGKPAAAPDGLLPGRRTTAVIAGLLFTCLALAGVGWAVTASRDIDPFDYVTSTVAPFTLYAPSAALGASAMLAGLASRRRMHTEQARPADGVRSEQQGSGAVHR